MPTYEYRCKKCGKAFEKFQSMTETALKKCPRPKCGGSVERLIGGGGGFIFKGTGFYQTDYKKPKAQGEGSKVKGEGEKKESPAKPEKKADKKE